jgi:hypothetical protein
MTTIFGIMALFEVGKHSVDKGAMFIIIFCKPAKWHQYSLLAQFQIDILGARVTQATLWRNYLQNERFVV